MWHEKYKPLEAQGKVRTIGLIQEQHPDRCALFMQWKEMDFPILVDSLNLLDVAVVPLTILIDEAGIVRAIRPDEAAVAAFAEAPKVEAPAVEPRPTPEGGLDHANRRIMFGDAADLDRALAAYEDHLTRQPKDARAHFRLGVAYRKRFDEAPTPRPDDFARAVRHWQQALAINPNQYIWRRRIQQYGPRLDKPYPFYDWVGQAQREIRARGREPETLRVELSGAEVAMPLRGGASDVLDATAGGAEPDPAGKINRDDASLFAIEPIIVRDTGKDQRVVRVHLFITPSSEALAKWNDEAGPSMVWIDPPRGWSVDRRLHALLPHGNESETATRSIDFEVRPRPGSDEVEGETAGAAIVRGYVLYHVCFGHEGICVHLRQDFAVAIAD